MVVEVKEVVKEEGMAVETVGAMVVEAMVVVKEEERVAEMEVDLEEVTVAEETEEGMEVAD